MTQLLTVQYRRGNSKKDSRVRFHCNHALVGFLEWQQQKPLMLSRPYAVIAYNEHVPCPSMDMGVCSGAEEENAMIRLETRESMNLITIKYNYD